MPSSRWVRATVLLTGLLWTGILLLRGIDIQASWLTSLGGVAGVVVVAFFVFEHYLWRAPIVRRFVHRRIIRGTWRGTLATSWRDRKTGQPPAPMDAYLVINQSYSSISMLLMTQESSSRSIAASLSDPARGQCTVSGVYMNTPRLLIQDRSRIHRGALILEVSGDPPARLEGCYFTDRDTKGELIFDARSPQLHEDFGSATSDRYT